MLDIFQSAEKQKKTDIKSRKIKAGSLPGKQNGKFSQNHKKFIKNLAVGWFATPTK